MEVFIYAILLCFAAEYGNLVVITLNQAHSTVVWLLLTINISSVEMLVTILVM